MSKLIIYFLQWTPTPLVRIRIHKAIVHSGSNQTIVTISFSHTCFTFVETPVVGVTFPPGHFPVTAPLMTSTVVIMAVITLTLNVVLVKEAVSPRMIVEIV